MATLGHLAIGMAAGRFYCRPQSGFLNLAVCMLVFCFFSLLPDLDMLGYYSGVKYLSEFGHRGFTHSLLFAATTGLLAAIVSLLWKLPFGKTFWVVFLTVASHGIADAFTRGGHGIAFFWPLTQQRYLFPWRPIPAAPFGRNFLTFRGMEILVTEIAWFLPFLAYALFPRSWFKEIYR